MRIISPTDLDASRRGGGGVVVNRGCRRVCEFKRLNGRQRRRESPLCAAPSSKKREKKEGGTTPIRSARESFNFQIEFCRGNFPLPFPARVTRLIDPLESPFRPSPKVDRCNIPPPRRRIFSSFPPSPSSLPASLSCRFII